MENEEPPSQPSTDPAPAMQFTLTHEQALYINRLLPANYSLQPLTAITRKDSREVEDALTNVEPRRRRATKDKAIDKDYLDENEEPPARKQRLPRSSQYPEAPSNHGSHNFHENGQQAMEVETDPEFRHCFSILARLKKHPSAEPFLQPVDPVELGIPDYFRIIKEPIDLSLIEHHLFSNAYQTPTQFHADVLQMFGNSYRYNNKGTDVYKCTIELERYYKRLLEKEEETIGYTFGSLNRDGFKRPADPHTSSASFLHRRKKKSKQPPPSLSEAQLAQLSVLIKKIPNTATAEVLKIITESRISLGQPIRNVQDIDLRQLEPAVLVELERFVRVRVGTQPRKRHRKRAEKQGMSVEKAKSARGHSVSSDFDPDAEG